VSAASLQKRAGRSAFSSIQRCIDLSGVEFPEETAKLSARLWGANGTKTQYEVAPQAAADLESAA